MTVAYVDGPGLRHFRDTYCLTAAQVNTLINAAITAYKQDVYTVVSTLPAQGVEGIGYLVPVQGQNLKYNVYTWEITDDTTTPPTYGFVQAGDGNVSVDLSNYYTKTEVDGLLSAKLNAADLVPLTNAEIDSLMV